MASQYLAPYASGRLRFAAVARSRGRARPSSTSENAPLLFARRSRSATRLDGMRSASSKDCTLPWAIAGRFRGGGCRSFPARRVAQIPVLVHRSVLNARATAPRGRQPSGPARRASPGTSRAPSPRRACPWSGCRPASSRRSLRRCSLGVLRHGAVVGGSSVFRALLLAGSAHYI